MMEKFGRYEIIKELGNGGMADVYLAYDPTLKREVALKVIKADHSNNSDFHKRFKREAKIMGSFQHSAIVPLYDSGEEEGQLYLVMALMSGGSLLDRLGPRPQPLPLDEVMPLMESLASGLDAAHQRGVVHRDLKPGNILFDKQGNAYIADFGIAKQTNRTTQQLTAVGAPIGTPEYMSPEQKRGEKEIDGRSDIFSLGIILFELLTGERPEKNNTAYLPPSFKKIINKAMAKKPQHRYATAGQMVKKLKVVVRNERGTTYKNERPVEVEVVIEKFWWESRLAQTVLGLLFIMAEVAVFVIGETIGGTLLGVSFVGLLAMLSWFMSGGPAGTLALVDQENPNRLLMGPWRLRPFPRYQSKSGPQLKDLGIEKIKLEKATRLTAEGQRAIKINAFSTDGEHFIMDLTLYAGGLPEAFTDDIDIVYG